MFTGCASLVSGLSSRMANDLADVILNSNDVHTVREGVPAYLLLIDSFLLSSPEDVNLLLAAARLNSSYSVFAGPVRRKLLNQKSFDYSKKAVCIMDAQLCDLQSVNFEEFQRTVSNMTVEQIDVSYSLGVAWAGWIQAHSSDWNAIGQLGRVKVLMEKIIDLDESWDSGGAHLYMGGLETLLPAAMGGHPEKGRAHFEQALAFAGGKYLMTQVIYAEQYARLVFDKELHDRLLHEVIVADPVVEGMTLTNRIAQARAVELLAESDEYF